MASHWAMCPPTHWSSHSRCYGDARRCSRHHHNRRKSPQSQRTRLRGRPEAARSRMVDPLAAEAMSICYQFSRTPHRFAGSQRTGMATAPRGHRFAWLMSTDHGPKSTCNNVHALAGPARGTVRPRALTVLRLITNSTFPDCCKGRSAAASISESTKLNPKPVREPPKPEVTGM